MTSLAPQTATRETDLRGEADFTGERSKIGWVLMRTNLWSE
jgi:hypothetical protein